MSIQFCMYIITKSTAKLLLSFIICKFFSQITQKVTPWCNTCIQPTVSSPTNPTAQTTPTFTPRNYCQLGIKYNYNTKSSKIQIYFCFFAQMVHFAFFAYNPLTLNAIFFIFRHFLYNFSKMIVLTKKIREFDISGRLRTS